MSKTVQKHPIDEGKYQSAFDNYGHGEGNGKSRQAVYKYARRLKSMQNDKVPSEDTDVVLSDSDSPPQEQESSEGTQDDWINISWAEDEGNDIPKANTIPDPLHKMAKSKGKGEFNKARRIMQSQFVRWGFISLDRLVTWWGRGVMSEPEWEIQRTPKDYDVLQGTTNTVLEAYEIEIPASPWMIWGAVVSSAYIPPVMHIHKNRDKTRKTRSIFSLLPFRWFKRKKKIKPGVLNPDDSEK